MAVRACSSNQTHSMALCSHAVAAWLCTGGGAGLAAGAAGTRAAWLGERAAAAAPTGPSASRPDALSLIMAVLPACSGLADVV